MLLADAREEAKKGCVKSAISIYREVFKIAKSIPHPSGMIAVLNDIAWYMKERHPKIAMNLSWRAVRLCGKFFETPKGYAIHTLFEIAKSRSIEDVFLVSQIVADFEDILDFKYPEILNVSKKLLPQDVHVYTPSKSMITFIKKHISSVRKAARLCGVSKDNLPKILNGKVKYVKSSTAIKLLSILKDSITLNSPEVFLKEYGRQILEREFEVATRRLFEMKYESRIRQFLATYISQVKRKHMARRDFLVKAITSLNNIRSFEKLVCARVEAKKLVVDCVFPNPFIEGRKEAILSFLNRLSNNTLLKFASVYVSLRETDKRVADRFLRNYGRYEVMRLRTRLKGPQVIREFAKRYRARVQPAFAAYWTESDGRVRRHVEYLAGRFVEKGF